MYQIFNLAKSVDSDENYVEKQEGPFTIVVRTANLSTSFGGAQDAYYAGLLKHWRRQLVCSLALSDVIVKAGRMQWTVGDVRMRSGVSSIGNYISRSLKAKLAGQEAIYPVFYGSGLVVLEPTMKNMRIVNLADWNGAIVLGECVFSAAQDSVKVTTISRTNFSSALLGKEGLFNYCLQGEGLAVIEYDPPNQEIVEVLLEDDELRMDGHFALAWSQSLNFTVETASSSWVSTALSQEGMVSVFKGTGRILLAPLMGVKADQDTKESK